MQSQIQKLDISLIDKNASNLTENSETKQSNVAIYSVESYHKVRDKYPFEIFLKK